MKTIVGIMGPNNSKEKNLKDAYEIGKYVAEKEYITLTGGLNRGIQNEALKGAKSSNGLTIGIMPFNEPKEYSEYVDIPIVTNMRSGRNYINSLSSNLVIACGVDNGTISEISLSLVKSNQKQVIIVGAIEEANSLFKKLNPNLVYIVKDYKECIELMKKIDF
jgi:Predicted Rossmann fold nucleotide-binding protein